MLDTSTPTPALPTNLQTVDEFEQWQRQYAHEGSYEFVRGRIIEKKEMKQVEAFIIKFLARLFTATSSYQHGDELFQEMDSYVDDTRKRRPDLAYFTAEQVDEMRVGQHVNTRFAIEILSESESFQDVTDKVQDYFDAGAVLVWYVLPANRKITVYTSADEARTYKGEETISAAPLLPDFQFTVSSLFA